jgi:hypothetical protein
MAKSRPTKPRRSTYSAWFNAVETLERENETWTMIVIIDIVISDIIVVMFVIVRAWKRDCWFRHFASHMLGSARPLDGCSVIALFTYRTTFVQLLNAVGIARIGCSKPWSRQIGQCLFERVLLLGSRAAPWPRVLIRHGDAPPIQQPLALGGGELFDRASLFEREVDRLSHCVRHGSFAVAKGFGGFRGTFPALPT